MDDPGVMNGPTAGLAQDLRLLKARGPVRSVLKEIQDRGSAW